MISVLRTIFTSDKPIEEKIYSAAKRNDSASLQRYVAGLPRGSPSLEWVDAEEMTALCVAAREGHWGCVDLLLKAGSNHRHCSLHRDGGTPLHEAVARQQPPCVQLLFAYGADPFVENRFGESAYDIALKHRNVQFMRTFEKRAAVGAWLLVKVPRNLGFSTEWKVHWLVLIERERSALLPTPRRVLHSQLFFYENHASSVPKVKTFTDGAFFKAPPGVTTADSPVSDPWILVLHPEAGKPQYVSTSQSVSWQIFMRPCSSAPEAIRFMDLLARKVNDTYFRALDHSHTAPSPLAWRPPPPPVTAPPPVPPPPPRPAQAAPAPSAAVGPAPSRPVPHAGRQGGPTPAANADAALALELQREDMRKAQLDPNDLSQLDRQFSQFSNKCSSQPSTSAQELETGEAASSTASGAAALPAAARQDRGSASAGRSSGPGADEGVCVICLEAPRQVGFLHGQSLHRCACRSCAEKWFRAKQTCPECNLAAQTIVNCYG